MVSLFLFRKRASEYSRLFPCCTVAHGQDKMGLQNLLPLNLAEANELANTLFIFLPRKRAFETGCYLAQQLLSLPQGGKNLWQVWDYGQQLFPVYLPRLRRPNKTGARGSSHCLGVLCARERMWNKQDYDIKYLWQHHSCACLMCHRHTTSDPVSSSEGDKDATNHCEDCPSLFPFPRWFTWEE